MPAAPLEGPNAVGPPDVPNDLFASRFASDLVSSASLSWGVAPGLMGCAHAPGGGVGHGRSVHGAPSPPWRARIGTSLAPLALTTAEAPPTWNANSNQWRTLICDPCSCGRPQPVAASTFGVSWGSLICRTIGACPPRGLVSLVDFLWLGNVLDNIIRMVRGPLGIKDGDFDQW